MYKRFVTCLQADAVSKGRFLSDNDTIEATRKLGRRLWKLRDSDIEREVLDTPRSSGPEKAPSCPHSSHRSGRSADDNQWCFESGNMSKSLRIVLGAAGLKQWRARRLPGSATMKTQVGRANMCSWACNAAVNHFGCTSIRQWLARRWTRLRSFWFRRTRKSKRPATKPKHSRPPWRRGQLSKESEDGRPCHDCRRDRASATQRDRAVQ